MKINTIYRSSKQKEDFWCVVHIHNKTVTRITSIEENYFKADLEKLQPSIYGAKYYYLWKAENESYPYEFVYYDVKGQHTLYLDCFKISYFLLKLRLKISNSYFILNFVGFSFIIVLGFFIMILSGEFILSDFEILIFVWSCLAVLNMWKSGEKLEKKEEEILDLKKKLIKNNEKQID